MPPTNSADPQKSPSVTATQPSPELIDPKVINPRTGLPWPKWNNTADVLLYLERVHGLKWAKQTVAHHRSKGIGIRWKWFGQVPVTTLAEVDRYAREEALQDRSPLAGRTRPAANTAASET